MSIEMNIQDEMESLMSFLPEKIEFKFKILRLLRDMMSENDICLNSSDDTAYEEGYEQAITDILGFIIEDSADRINELL